MQPFSPRRLAHNAARTPVPTPLILALCALAALARPTHAIQPAGGESDAQRVLPSGWVVGGERSGVVLRSIEATAEARGPVARTTLRLTLDNPGPRQAEARVLLPVPAGAAVVSMRLEDLGEAGVATLLDADKAREVYERIVRLARDPAVLELAGSGLVRTSVFPVPAGGQRVVSLAYEHTLPTHGRRVDYTLPRPWRSRAASGGAAVAWTLELTIDSPLPIGAIASPTHAVRLERGGERRAIVRANADALSAADGPVRVSWLERGGEDGEAGVLAYPTPEGGGYFMLLASAPKPDADAPGPKREVTLVLDRSGSMRGQKLAQAKAAALDVLAGLDNGDAFNIIAYADGVDRYAHAPVVVGSEDPKASLKRVRRFIDAIDADGGTNIHDALLAALRPTPPADALPMVLFLTDGLPTVGERDELAIGAMVGKANAHARRVLCFGVGYDVNAPLLTRVARATRGRADFVLPGQDVERAVSAVFDRLRGPVLALPELRASDPARLANVMPRKLPDVFEGGRILAVGRYAAGSPIGVELRGRTPAGADHAIPATILPDQADVRNAFVGRLWARRRIAELVEAVRQAGAGGASGAPPEELVDEIVSLSLRWGVMTEYTAFLALEPGVAIDQQVAAFGRELDDEGVARMFEVIASQGQADTTDGGRDAVGKRLRAGQRQRTGASGVRQEKNNVLAARASAADTATLRTAGGARVVLAGVRAAGDLTLFRRDGRWVDGRLLAHDRGAGSDGSDETDGKADPQWGEEVPFAGEAYFRLAADLANKGRQGALSQGGDVLLLHGGRRLLVRGPAEDSP